MILYLKYWADHWKCYKASRLKILCVHFVVFKFRWLLTLNWMNYTSICIVSVWHILWQALVRKITLESVLWCVCVTNLSLNLNVRLFDSIFFDLWKNEISGQRNTTDFIRPSLHRHSADVSTFNNVSEQGANFLSAHTHYQNGKLNYVIAIPA